MNRKEIYLAGGCFWGMQMVCHQDTGFAETLKLCYDADTLSLSFLLSLYFDVIDPTSYHRQGNDIGEQYRTGIYYVDAMDAAVIEASMLKLAKQYEKAIVVECKPLTNYYPAEVYHQEYLKKNPQGYCHISHEKIDAIKHIPPQKD